MRNWIRLTQKAKLSGFKWSDEFRIELDDLVKAGKMTQVERDRRWQKAKDDVRRILKLLGLDERWGRQ